MSDVGNTEGSEGSGNPEGAAPVSTTVDAGSAPAGNPTETNLGGGDNGSSPSQYGTNLNEDGPGFDWAANASPDNLSAIQNKGWNNVDDMFHSYSELEQKIGERRLESPDPEVATQEDWDSYYDALGRPAEPADYGFQMPEGVSENFQYDSEFADHYRQMAHRAGLTDRQANQLHGEYVAMMDQSQGETFRSTDQAVGEAHASLQTAWGEEGTENYNRNLEMATRAMNQLGLESALLRTGVIAPGGAVLEPDIVVALAKVGQNNYAEDNMYGGVGSVVVNPFAEKTENMTIASQMIQNDPQRARNLIAAAGGKPEDYGI